MAGSKITGEEDRYSHTDLSDFQANLDGRAGGVRAARARRSSSAATATLATTIDARFAAVQKGLDRTSAPTPLGFALTTS